MKRTFLLFTVFFVCAVVFGGLVFADEEIRVKKFSPSGQKYVPGEIIVKFKPGTKAQAIEEINKKNGTKVIKASKFAGFKLLKVPQGKTAEDMVKKYKSDVRVEYSEPNFIAYAHMVPNDTYYSLQWHLDNLDYGGIHMEAAWDLSAGFGVIVAVIDTGVAYEDYSERIRRRKVYYYKAPDLANTTFVPGYDFVNNDAHPNDDNGHGTHVTGTIAQSTNNFDGVAGVAYECSIMPVKVLDSERYGSHYDIAEGIYFAADNGAQVINMSLGGPVSSDTLKYALAYAYGKGVTIICSSGNAGSPTVGFPAAYDAYCIAVGATRYDETVSYYSNGGPSLDIVAPGGDMTPGLDQNDDGYADGVLQQTHDGKDYGTFIYYFYQGTSMAAPHVSGVAALVIEYGIASTPDGVREVLQSTAEDKGATGWDPQYGWGLVDASAALNYGFGDNSPPIADAGPDQSALTGATLTFDGSGSSDSDGGTIVLYVWDFGDGETASGRGETASHSYAAAGTFTVALIVTDDGGLSNTDTAVVTISGAMHVADITMSTKKKGVNVSAIAAITVSDADGQPVAGAEVFGQWSGLTSDSDSGLTDENGIVSFSSNNLRKPGGTFTFTVNGVVKDEWTYDLSSPEPSGSITVP